MSMFFTVHPSKVIRPHCRKHHTLQLQNIEKSNWKLPESILPVDITHIVLCRLLGGNVINGTLIAQG